MPEIAEDFSHFFSVIAGRKDKTGHQGGRDAGSFQCLYCQDFSRINKSSCIDDYKYSLCFFSFYLVMVMITVSLKSNSLFSSFWFSTKRFSWHSLTE